MSRPAELPPEAPPPGALPVPPRSARFPKEARLRQRREYLQAQARGKKLYTRHFGICLAPAAGAAPRLGLAVSRKVGPAAQRNRVKRLLREFFRRHQQLLPPMDIIIMAKKGASFLTYAQVQAELLRILTAGAPVDPHD